MDHVIVAKEQTLPPPLVVMSLNIKSVLNLKTRSNEVCVGVCDLCVCKCIYVVAREANMMLFIVIIIALANSLECGAAHLEWLDTIHVEQHNKC